MTDAAGEAQDLFPPLEAEGLVLRALRPGDAATLHRLVNDWPVARMLRQVPFPYPRELADEWIGSSRGRIAAGTAWHLAIERDGALVGCIGLTVSAPREAELGYWVGRRFWGAGVATRAAGRLCRWALANLDLDVIRASALEENPASAAVLRRIGFVADGAMELDFPARNARLPVARFRAGRAEMRAAEPVLVPTAVMPPAGMAAGANLLLVAACALVDADGRVLLARRPEGKPMAGLWEFPGGKLHPGETPEAALIRELEEELGVDVSANCLAPFAFASHPMEDGRHLLMPLYLCRRWGGEATAREGQALAWVRPARLGDYAMPPADKPLVALLRDFL